MNKKIKQKLKKAFEPPKPKRKEEFIQSINYPHVSWFGFLAMQAYYIRKRVWAVSFLLMMAVFFLLPLLMDANTLIWTISAFLPFIALVGITEIARSMSFNMAELEMSCKYSFSDIVLARLLILGAVNAIIFTIITISLLRINSTGIMPLVANLFTPYLLSCSLSLFSINHYRLRGNVYVYGTVSVFVSMLSLILLNQHNHILPEGNWLLWSFWLLIFWLLAEIKKFIKRMEENQWSLSLTA